MVLVTGARGEFSYVTEQVTVLLRKLMHGDPVINPSGKRLMSYSALAKIVKLSPSTVKRILEHGKFKELISDPPNIHPRQKLT